MNMSLRIVFVLVISFALTMAQGCAESQLISRSGFLTSYPRFIRPGPEGGVDLRYIKEGVDFSSYNKLMMDPIGFHLSEEVEYKAICPSEQKELSDTLYRILVKTLADAYPLVDKPGPDVLRFRIAITDVFATKPILRQIPNLWDLSLWHLDIMRTIMPSGGTIRSLKDESNIFTFGGEASMEAELLDSRTNEQLAVAIDRKKTERYKLSYGKWEHVEDAFEFWAKRLRLFLDKAHDKNVGEGLKAAKL
jgi:hypothetical protein